MNDMDYLFRDTNLSLTGQGLFPAVNRRRQHKPRCRRIVIGLSCLLFWASGLAVSIEVPEFDRTVYEIYPIGKVRVQGLFHMRPMERELLGKLEEMKLKNGEYLNSALIRRAIDHFKTLEFIERISVESRLYQNGAEKKKSPSFSYAVKNRS